jgi:AraC family transcriptional regulator, transcriptional activator for feuABC-ybbA operon
LEGEISVNVTLEDFDSINYIVPYIRYIAKDQYFKPFELKERILTFHYLVLVCEGKGKFVIGNETYMGITGSVILIKPGVLHNIITFEEPFHAIAVHLDFYSRVGENLSFIRKLYLGDFPIIHNTTEQGDTVELVKVVIDFPCFHQTKNIEIINLFYKAFEEPYKHEVGWHKISSSAIMEILTLLKREIMMDENSMLDNKNKELIEQVLGYINEKYRSPVILRDLCEISHMSSDYLRKLFKSYVGLSPQKYLVRYRIMQAKNYLHDKKSKVEWVATYCGFKDIYSFSKIFKKYEGISPSQYQNTIS